MADETKKTKCYCGLIAGVVLLFLGLFADVLGLGQSTIFGPKQILAVTVGLWLIIRGVKGSGSCLCCKKDKK